jgi:hypothetical protein
MTSEKAFQLYFAIKLHFTTDYNVFEQGTNFRGKSTLPTRKDFKLIEPLVDSVKTERQFIELCVCNHLYGNHNFLYDDTFAYDNYTTWCRNKQSLDYIFERDLDYIEFYMLKYNCSLDKYLSEHVISDLLSSKIEYESLILLNRDIQVIDLISGFDAIKYRVRMHKANLFVNKGTLGLRHINRIDTFKQSL